MEQYEEYKDSGVEWIGEIPVEWEVKKLKSIAFLKTGYTPSKKEKENYSDDGITWVKPNDLRGFNPVCESKEKVSKLGLKVQNIVPEGSLLVCCVGSVGKYGVAGVPLITNQQINSLIFSHHDFVTDVFGKYLIAASVDEHERNANGNVVKILNTENQGNIFFPIPPKPKQTTIANFLGRKTVEIDALIAQKELLLELYKEERTAVINHAVTKGIDPNAELKDSGVEWIGDIPAGWKIKRFRYLFDSVTEKIEDDLPKIGLENIENKTGKLIETNSYFDGDGIHFMSGDILFGKLRPYLAKVHLAEFQGKAVGDFFIFRSKNEIYERFGARLISSKSFIEITNGSTFGAKMPRVSWDFVSNLLIAYPNIEEQTAIANFLDRKMAEIDAKIARTQRIIELQKEYRTTLISDVITGKIKVSHLAEEAD